MNTRSAYRVRAGMTQEADAFGRRWTVGQPQLRCPARHPINGRQCAEDAGHGGGSAKHQAHVGLGASVRWGDSCQGRDCGTCTDCLMADRPREPQYNGDE